VSVPDPIGELVALLLDDSEVAEIAGQNVFGGGLPAEVRADMPQAAVVVTAAGGPGRRGYNRYRVTRVDTTCYGQTLKESWDLHAVVRELLENLRRSGALFWAQTISDGVNGIDPKERWPTCFAGYQVLSASDTDD
jgi:hypothetical protein